MLKKSVVALALVAALLAAPAEAQNITAPPPPVPQDRQFVLGQHLRLSVLTAAEETDGRHDLSDVTLAAGAGTPLHLHTGYEERIWVVDGSLTVWSGPDAFTLRSGDFYTVPMNVPHTIKAGPDGARSLNITSPGRFAELIRIMVQADLAEQNMLQAQLRALQL